MAVVKGDTVKVHYTGKFEDGEIFDSSVDRDPFIFKTGAEMVIPGFDNAIIGMEIGDKKTVTIPAADAYGEWLEENTLAVPRTQFPEGVELEEGMHFHLRDDDGGAIEAVVAEIQDENVILDANHPLAGETLVFEIELLEVGCELPKQHEHCHDGGCGCCG